MGGLSDKLGRRPVLLAALLGLGLDYVFLSFAPTLAWLFVGRVIAGITGASFTTATAYIADISTPETGPRTLAWWARRLAWGSSSARRWAGSWSFRLAGALYGGGGTELVQFPVRLFVLPESLVPAKRRPFEWSRANPLTSLLRLGRYPGVLWAWWPRCC